MLYLLVRREVSEPVALWSAGLYAVLPLNIFYARAFMPESAMLMFSAAGVAAFAWWMDRDSRAGLVLSAALIALAALLKIVALYLAIPLFFLAWRKYGAALFRRWRLYAFALLVLLPVGAWYVHAHAIFREYGHTFGIWMFGTNKWGIFDILFTAKWYNDIFFKSIAERHLTYAGFIPFLAGAWVFRSDPRYRLFLWWLAGVTFYFLLVASGNQIHQYYQLPFTLPAVVFVGGVLDRFLSGGKLRRRAAESAVGNAGAHDLPDRSSRPELPAGSELHARRAPRQLALPSCGGCRTGDRPRRPRGGEIKGVVDMAEPLLQKHNAALEQPIRFIQDVDHNLPLTACDRRRFRQVLLNLLSNAIKFTEQGSITLSAKKKREEFIFAVMDTGPGIPQKIQARIFEQFIQATDDIKHTQGTGLGLPISRSLVEAHGGDLWVESNMGEGSTFYFTLPFRPATKP